MTEYAHNHPPVCCCIHGTDPAGRCPLCPEHGELAQLGKSNPIIGEYVLQPGTVEVMACCNQLAGRPHTDYCQTGRGITPEMQDLGERMIADEIANTAADRGARFGMTHQPTTHQAASHIYRQDQHPVHECHPDRCGMWATQTTHPATQTSTPDTQHRAPADPCLCVYGSQPPYPEHIEPDCPIHGTHREPTPHATPTPGDAAEPCIVDGTPCPRWPGCRC